MRTVHHRNVLDARFFSSLLEHIQFQTLYEKLKDRKDVVLLSFNVDDDPGLIEPYMKQYGYTFPVIPAGLSVVDANQVVLAAAPQLELPRNWFIDSGGKFLWEQVGFENDPKWSEKVLGKLEEVLKRDR